MGTYFFTKFYLYNSKNVLNLHPPTLQGVGASKGTALECVELAHGVIGNTPVFGAVIQGSSPCGPTIIGKVSNFYLGLFLWNRFMAYEIVGGLRKRKRNFIKLHFLLRNALLS